MESGLETLVPLSLMLFPSSHHIAFMKSKVESMHSRFDHQRGECREQVVLDASPPFATLASFGAGFIPTEPFSNTPVPFPLSFAVPGHSEQGVIPTDTTQLGNCPLAALSSQCPTDSLTLNLFLLSLTGSSALSLLLFSFPPLSGNPSAISKMQKHEERNNIQEEKRKRRGSTN